MFGNKNEKQPNPRYRRTTETEAARVDREFDQELPRRAMAFLDTRSEQRTEEGKSEVLDGNHPKRFLQSIGQESLYADFSNTLDAIQENFSKTPNHPKWRERWSNLDFAEDFRYIDPSRREIVEKYIDWLLVPRTQPITMGRHAKGYN